MGNRRTPTLSSHPSGISGADYADDVADEVASLYRGITNVVGSLGGTANAITGVCTPPFTTDFAHGERFLMIPAANNTGAVTINIDSRGVIALRDMDDAALVAGDLVAGRPVEFIYNAVTERFQLVQPTMRALVAQMSAEVATKGLWEKFGDTTVSTAVASIEHTFTAGRYSKIFMSLMGVGHSISGSINLNVQLRNASSALLTATSSETVGSTGRFQGGAEFLIDVNTSSRGLYGTLYGFGGGPVMTRTEAVTTTTNTPDRVRVAFGSGNIDEGRVLSYGLRVSE